MLFRSIQICFDELHPNSCYFGMNVFSKRVYNLIPHLRHAFLARHFLIEPLPDGRDAFGLEPEQARNVCQALRVMAADSLGTALP